MREAAFGLARIGQIAQVVRDVDAAKAFYRDKLGMRFLFEVPGPMAFFDCDGTWLMLAAPEPGAEAEHTGSILYFQVEDIEAAHRTLADRGVAFVQAPHKIADLGERELWLAFFRDEDGNLLALRSEVPKAG